jgi:hypothetical protein
VNNPLSFLDLLPNTPVVEGFRMNTFPPVEHPVWEKLVTGELKFKFSLFAANMALDRITRVYAVDKKGKENLASELHDFFKKYEHLIASDLASIASGDK